MYHYEQLERPYLAMLFPANILYPPPSLNWQLCIQMLNPKQHRDCLATFSHPVYLKCGKTTTRWWKLLNSAISGSTTPKSKARHPLRADRLVYVDHQPLLAAANYERVLAANSWLLPRAPEPYHGISTTSLTLSANQDRELKKIFLDPGADVASSLHLQISIVEAKEQAPSSNTPYGHPREGNDKLGQRADEENKSRQYTLDHIVQHVLSER